LNASSAPKTSFKDAIGVFGGRFDPPHRMHLAIARQALAQLGLAEIHWVVSGIAPHKPTIASPEDRLAMVQCVLAQENDSRMRANDFEVKASRQGRLSYTIDTLRALATTYPGRRLVLIIGSDQAEHFETWKDWREILGMVDLAIVKRPGFSATEIDALLKSAHAACTDLRVEQSWISATSIRADLATGKVRHKDLTKEVYNYINQYHLYETHHSCMSKR
jgi:nicotinate-nucleotide adenylyltransferase